MRYQIYSSQGQHIASTREARDGILLVAGDRGAVVRDVHNDNQIVWEESPDDPSLESPALEPDQIQLTPASDALFREFCADAKNWSGKPLVNGNVSVDWQRRGNLAELQNKGLVKLFNHFHAGSGYDNWVAFTELGLAYADANGIPIDE